VAAAIVLVLLVATLVLRLEQVRSQTGAIAVYAILIPLGLWLLNFGIVRGAEWFIRDAVLQSPKPPLRTSGRILVTSLLFAAEMGPGGLGDYVGNLLVLSVRDEALLPPTAQALTFFTIVLQSVLVTGFILTNLYSVGAEAGGADGPRAKRAKTALKVAYLVSWFGLSAVLPSFAPGIREVVLGNVLVGAAIIFSAIPLLGSDTGMLCYDVSDYLRIPRAPETFACLSPEQPTLRLKLSWVVAAALVTVSVFWLVWEQKDSIYGAAIFLGVAVVIVVVQGLIAFKNAMSPEIGRLTLLEHLALAAESGVPLHEAVESFLLGESSLRMKEQASALLFYLNCGYTLDRAASAVRSLFTPQEVACLRAAKEGDDLAAALRFIAQEDRLKSRVVSRFPSVAWYAFWLAIILAYCVYTGLIILHKFGAILSQFKFESLAAFRRLTLLMHFLGQLVWILPLLFVAFFVMRKALASSLYFRRLLSKLAPAVVELHWLGSLSRFAHALYLQLSKCVPIEEAVTTAMEATGDRALQSRRSLIADKLRQGLPLHRALQIAGDFPPSFISHLALGAKKENLPEVLRFLADIYPRRELLLRERLHTFTFIAVMMATLGLGLWFAVNFYLMLFSLTQIVPYD
jgi:general secretion pathway protein F